MLGPIMVGAIMNILGDMSDRPPSPPMMVNPFDNFVQFFGSICTLVFSYGSIVVVPSVQVQMKDESEMPKVIAWANAFCILFYAAFSLVTIFGFGPVEDEILTIIYDNFPDFRIGWYVSSVACVLLMLDQLPLVQERDIQKSFSNFNKFVRFSCFFNQNLFLFSKFYFFQVSMCVYSAAEQRWPSLKTDRCKKHMFRTLLLGIGLGLACLPGGLFKDMMGLIPSVTQTTVTLVFPVWFYYAALVMKEKSLDVGSRSLLDHDVEALNDVGDLRERVKRENVVNGDVSLQPITTCQAVGKVIANGPIKFIFHMLILVLAATTSIFGVWNAIVNMANGK